MTREALQRKESFLMETLLSGLDARESARAADAPLLLYLTEMLVQRTRQDLEALRASAEIITDRASG